MLINSNQSSFSGRAIIYFGLLCFYDYGPWVLFPIYSKGAHLGVDWVRKITFSVAKFVSKLGRHWHYASDENVLRSCLLCGLWPGPRIWHPPTDWERRISDGSPWHWPSLCSASPVSTGSPPSTHCLGSLCEVGFVNLLPMREPTSSTENLDPWSRVLGRVNGRNGTWARLHVSHAHLP